MRTISLRLLAVIILTLTVSGCQNGSAHGNSTQVVNATITDQGCPKINVRAEAGSTVQVRLNNQSEQSQVIGILVYPAALEVNPQDPKNTFWQVRLQPGFSMIEDLTVPQMPGEYEIVCGSAEELTLARTGTLTVFQPNP